MGNVNDKIKKILPSCIYSNLRNVESTDRLYYNEAFYEADLIEETEPELPEPELPEPEFPEPEGPNRDFYSGLSTKEAAEMSRTELIHMRNTYENATKIEDWLQRNAGAGSISVSTRTLNKSTQLLSGSGYR